VGVPLAGDAADTVARNTGRMRETVAAAVDDWYWRQTMVRPV